MTDPDDLDPVEVPSASSCPYCGGEPTEQSNARHQLSVLDYLHDDVKLRCDECDRTWRCGVPIGGPPPEAFAYLWCDSCDGGFMLVHRVQVLAFNEHGGDHAGMIRLNLKCPNHLPLECSCGLMGEPAWTKSGEATCRGCGRTYGEKELAGRGCFHFDTYDLPLDEYGVAPTSYPQITGDTENADPYGGR